MLPEGEKILKRKSRFKSAKIENLVENLSPFIVQIKSY
jgi:hypothetical protein